MQSPSRLTPRHANAYHKEYLRVISFPLAVQAMVLEEEFKRPVTWFL